MARIFKKKRRPVHPFCLLSPAAFGQLRLTYDQRIYKVVFPCEEDYVCFHMWRITTNKVDDDVAVVTNGNLRSAESEGGTSECVLSIKDHTDKDYHHVCHLSPGVSTPYSGECRLVESHT